MLGAEAGEGLLLPQSGAVFMGWSDSTPEDGEVISTSYSPDSPLCSSASTSNSQPDSISELDECFDVRNWYWCGCWILLMILQMIWPVVLLRPRSRFRGRRHHGVVRADGDRRRLGGTVVASRIRSESVGKRRRRLGL